MEIDKSQTKSTNGSRLSKIENNKNNISEDISMSQLELLANKKKLNKKSEEISLNNEPRIDSDITNEKKKISTVSSKSPPRKKSTLHKKIDSSISSDLSETSTEFKKKTKHKIHKENKNEETRKEKSELLYKLYTIIDKSNGRWTCKLTMDDSLEEIKNEFTRIKAILDNEAMVKFCKHGLVMGIKGIEMLNGAYDPIGVDLDGWSESMSYNMSTNEYDEVLSELCEKYKGTGSMSPEIKLLLMIVMSGAMFSFSKKAAKDPNTLTNLMGSMFKKTQSSPQPPPSPPQSTPQRQSISESGRNDSSLAQLAESLRNKRQMDNDTEDSDNIPAKIRGPSFDSPDSVNIENIIQTMREKNQKKEVLQTEFKIRPDIEQILNESELSDEIVKNIPTPKQRGKGRPRKTTKSKPVART
jgi:hypothetical protein